MKALSSTVLFGFTWRTAGFDQDMNQQATYAPIKNEGVK